MRNTGLIQVLREQNEIKHGSMVWDGDFNSDASNPTNLNSETVKSANFNSETFPNPNAFASASNPAT